MTDVSESSQIFTATTPGYTDSKYIVSARCLLELFEKCPICKRPSEVTPCRRGTFLAVYQKCPHCGFYREWKSQPVIGSCPIINLQLSAAIYFTGTSFFQLQKVFKAMHLKSIGYTTFRRHARTYLEPAVIHKWHQFQEEELQFLSQRKVKIGGDMRADSPGHCAKYGSYSLINLENNNIIDTQLVQSNEVGGSHNMEKEGLKRSLELLESKGVAVDYIVTDRHPQIQKFLRDRNVKHFYDVRHLAKGLSKKLDKVSKEKDCDIVKRWRRGISNHVYWAATSSSTGAEKVAKWTSLINHIQNIHSHDNPAFPKCLHPVRRTRDPKKWFQPGTKALYKVEKILTSKRVLTDVEKLSSKYQTSTLEAFHSVILRFTPKNVVFPFIGMLCRLYLAAMHFNENAGRCQAKTNSGRLRYKLSFPKAKKGAATVKAVKTQRTYCYTLSLMHLLFEEVVPNPLPYLEECQQIPVPSSLSSQHERPPLKDAIAAHVSRFRVEEV
ncbi:uncharacterized protein LOC115551293 [Gadus morhua]|uniref:uncharacterized protein LOC115551293 n=1 Tax=Gadus morhua TaxID=8049 RepID=UPI0011B807AB|nr:uncharacterized protein LOC115551293 [Gadus morhua]XP_030222828.1 uncharacterized protein LOC115551293 [Gadus morhua]XP_030222829.1 uncharacterized protein LOC115551293 [Gadus morhua]XP_030222830.1 uncharacterized protein LOC115551293 [Gadus morhua]XP_030222831.1 uncharacterized protein LOC115551293 [Gadus morhua]XP_030222832.1 uncharacterized protein LOC115551293 [Gadus morhua]XP_030222833.1 uncharacterized protein LOC115551293 [Gadus morhua]XP_030222834.1 uncharacterized protein LOC1155